MSRAGDKFLELLQKSVGVILVYTIAFVSMSSARAFDSDDSEAVSNTRSLNSSSLNSDGKSMAFEREELDSGTIEKSINTSNTPFSLFPETYEALLLESHGESTYAKFKLGVLYHAGQGGRAQNYQQAVKWYRMVANNPNAQCNLGIMYEQGYGVEQDKVEAIKWYKIAIRNGFVKLRENSPKVFDFP